DVLSVPPLLIEKYLDAAEQITDKALLTEDEYKLHALVRARDLKTEGGVEDGPREMKGLYSRGTVSARFDVRVPGEYLIRIMAGADQAGDEPARMELKLGDSVLATLDVPGDRNPQPYEHKLAVEPGTRTVAVTFVNDFYNPDEKLDRNLYVQS